jgi:subtilisin family serine protease
MPLSIVLMGVTFNLLNAFMQGGWIFYISPDDYYKYTTATDALGFQYLFDYADSQGQPCVASFSEGYNAMNDADDRLFAEYLDRLNSPGHIIVVSAGNQGHLTTYASKSAAQTEAGAFIDAGNKTVNYCLQIHGETRLHIYYYNDGKTTPTDTLTIHSSDGRLDSLLSDTIRTTADTLAITASRHPAAFGTATILQITITASRHTSTLNRIALVVSGGNGEAEIFGSSSCQLVSRTNIDPRWTAAQPGHNILAPGWFPAAICVGMTAHRQQFTNIRGEQQAIIPNKTAGILSDYSSRGPTMEGLTKPDVVAPGINTVSSISSYYREANPTAGDASFDIASFDFGNRTYYWGAKSGTSMSCPVVAGAIALWLQAKPTLTREEIIGIFARTCRRPDASLTYPNNDYGWGEIDVYRGLLDILGLTAVETISQHRQQAATMRIADGRLTMQFSSAPSHPISVSVYSVAGCRLQQWHLPAGSTDVSVELPRLPGGIYAIQLTSRDSRITGSQLVRIE